MKSMALSGLRDMRFMDVAKPAISSDTDVLIRIVTVGVCGSDIHYYTTGKIGSQIVKYPFVVGHECAGIVEEIGSGVTHVKKGDRIAVEPAMPCFACDQCNAGRPHTCRKLRFLGCPGQAAGCLSEYLVMPQTSCIPIPDTVTFDGAAFSEPFAIGMYAVKMSVPMQGARAAILGSGPIGLSVLFAARALGVQSVYMTDKLHDRVLFARAAGATWAGNPDSQQIVPEILAQEPGGMDVVFECCGQQESTDQAIELLKPGGKLMLIGIPEFDRFTFSADLLRRKEIAIQNVRRQNGCAEDAVKMIAQGVVPVDMVCTHSFTFDKTKEAFDLVAGYRDGVIKAMIQLS
jgi:L-iditol 2-dehydrogenase